MADINFGVNILPKTNSAYNLGSSTLKWNLYANTINGTSVESIINGSGGSGSSLPSVTSSDNYKVLGVLSGSWSKMSLLSTYITRPSYIADNIRDPTLMSLINDLRANRIAFLPADQIIIEKTTDGGVTWEDAGVADIDKAKLFSEQRPSIVLPRINNERSTLCGLRITFTAMKYNVPENTSETNKYNYWNSNYCVSNERYSSLREMYFWLGTNGDKMTIQVLRAKGNAPDTWENCFLNNNALFSGWSGNNYILFSGTYTFGGNSTLTSNYWNYRVIIMSAYNANASEFANAGSLSVYEIRAYGPTWWTRGTNYAASDHLYSFDYEKNATFPNNVKATGYFINKYGNLMPYDVKINNATIVTDGVANIPLANTALAGVVKVNSLYGTAMRSSPNEDTIMLSKATADTIKAAQQSYQPIVPAYLHYAVFYGLAAAAGDTTQKATSTAPSNEIGTYTSEAKRAIHYMLGIESSANFVEEISTSVVTINGVPNTKYSCGEVTTITIIPPTSGTIDVWFTSGATPATLNVDGIVLPEWFDSENLEADTVYEIVITDGFGGIATWPVLIASIQ